MQLMLDGLKLMVAGMGMVFIFLCIMILWIVVSSKLSARFSHLFPIESPAAATAAANRTVRPGAESNRLIAIISAALQFYRRDHPDE